MTSYLRGKTWSEMIQEFQIRFPNMRSPARSTFSKIIRKFLTSYTVHNLNKGLSGRPRAVRTIQNIERVRLLLDRERDLPVGYFRSSARRNNLGIGKSTFNVITKQDLKYKPLCDGQVLQAYRASKAHESDNVSIFDPTTSAVLCSSFGIR